MSLFLFIWAAELVLDEGEGVDEMDGVGAGMVSDVQQGLGLGLGGGGGKEWKGD